MIGERGWMERELMVQGSIWLPVGSQKPPILTFGYPIHFASRHLATKYFVLLQVYDGIGH